MKKICVVTGTRAEYGLLYWTLKALQEDDTLDLQLCVTGMHLSPEFGLTYKQIEEDGFQIDKKVEVLLSSDSSVGISKSIGLGVISFSEAFTELQPDLVLVLGDRFEIFAAATAAMICKIPIAHCHGGEATEGAFDESIRHSITKMAHIHFTATEEYRRRVIQLGEQPANVHHVGALGIENINRLELLDRQAFEESIDFKLGKRNVLVTFHPVTLENATAAHQFKELLRALDELEDTHLIFTKPNADTDGRVIIHLIDEYVKAHADRSAAFVSLGQLRYLSALQHVDAVVGNSSSGLLEAPSFRKATIDIGDRQRGRIKAESVISCSPDHAAIREALRKAFSTSFRASLREVKNPYGEKNASEEIIRVLKEVDTEGLLKKKFFDLR
ncbi:GDP/UDP-N,N'-diacetylbacillosamine 2-epimerase (hydrolysing) [Pontibacter ummariensis]|uniref:GDP/UDP-N,N'-diacetylbacillosamine 2-epimerase (Hydrolysing) n=1 Tax=Pontibacter ummariensis TaxID=1610492 RepID=A0A239EL60_9BACT|nr:UDP-N-acetylglucosamine 2-epimerase [Pontibacter ummariensis]PRY13293.1 GDP/UDP-N,N'-diacetylbacillosamine 2-epimerase (hydrolysing) [Pontibacter ummariensis]SNS44783.1 GDP/UDP-N,N'-diacetylbacillosamine 2-epimerase (hydrolysing) [Pontibacter ummariensis]